MLLAHREERKEARQSTRIETLPASREGFSWETDFYTSPLLGGAVLFDNPAPGSKGGLQF